MLTSLIALALTAADGGVGLQVEFAPGAFDDVAPVQSEAVTAPVPRALPVAASPPARAPAPAPVPAAAASPADESTGAAPPADEGDGASKVRLSGALEGAFELLPSGFGAMGLDAYFSVRPVLGFGVGDAFDIGLGPRFRLLLVDSAPANRPLDFGGALRREDWDEASDFMQLLQALRIAPDSSPFFVRAGVMRQKTLGLGHLVSRYSAQENADYRPASLSAVLRVGPVRGELFASDVLFGRLVAGDVGIDLGAIFSSKPEHADRYIIAVELAHDAQRAGLAFLPDEASVRAPVTPATLLHVDGSAVLVRNPSLRLLVLAGLGTRFDTRADLGFVVGGAMDATIREIGLSLKLEARSLGGGFRHDYFGPGYELQRFADVGFSGPSIADALLPDTYSVYVEARVGIGEAFSTDAAVEYFAFGRTDLDASLHLELLDGWLVGEARLTAVGLGQKPRFHTTLGAHVRIFSSFYAFGSAGTVFFPQPDGTLQRGVTVSAGVGVDFER